MDVGYVGVGVVGEFEFLNFFVFGVDFGVWGYFDGDLSY